MQIRLSLSSDAKTRIKTKPMLPEVPAISRLTIPDDSSKEVVDTVMSLPRELGARAQPKNDVDYDSDIQCMGVLPSKDVFDKCIEGLPERDEILSSENPRLIAALQGFFDGPVSVDCESDYKLIVAANKRRESNGSTLISVIKCSHFDRFSDDESVTSKKRKPACEVQEHDTIKSNKGDITVRKKNKVALSHSLSSEVIQKIWTTVEETWGDDKDGSCLSFALRDTLRSFNNEMTESGFCPVGMEQSRFRAKEILDRARTDGFLPSDTYDHHQTLIKQAWVNMLHATKKRDAAMFGVYLRELLFLLSDDGANRSNDLIHKTILRRNP